METRNIRARTVRPLLTLCAAIFGLILSVHTAALGQAGISSLSARRQLLSIEDMIAWNALRPVPRGNDFADFYFPEGRILYSPDRKYFLLRTTQGDLKLNRVHDRLLVYRTPEVLSYLRTNRSAPAPIRILDRPAEREQNQIAYVQWLNGDSFGFVGQSDLGANQAFRFSVSSGRLVQLSRSDTDVVSFAFANNTLVYLAKVPQGSKPVEWVGESSLGALLAPLNDNGFPIVRLIVSRPGEGPRPVAMPPMRMKWYLQKLWISPDARYAVARLPAVSWPIGWEKYQLPQCKFNCFLPDRRSADPTSMALIQRQRYFLIDLITLKARPLLDAPTGTLAGTNVPPFAIFTAHDQSVLISNTFLPLTGADLARRRSTTAIAEVSLPNGRVRNVTWATPNQNSILSIQPNRITDVSWNEVRQELSVTSVRPGGSHLVSHYERTSSGWAGTYSQVQDPPLKLSVRESYTMPPMVVVEGSGCNCRKVLFDPNPSVHVPSKMDLFAWKDDAGRQWEGGLLYPIDFDPARKYPLIVQTHGFNRDEFLIDGPDAMHTAFAARAFAGAGFFVLQIEDQSSIEYTAHQADDYAAGYASGIRKLVSMGLVGNGQIGAIGFSSTGLGVLRLLSKYPDLVQAAVVADASVDGYLTQLDDVNFPVDFKVQGEAAGLKTPFEMPLEKWWPRNPIPKLANLQKPVLLQVIDAGATVHEWEIYATLRGRGAPTDLLHVPFGSHVLYNPTERLASQGASLDWFLFWLRAYEDTKPSKRAQYVRWEAMRTSWKRSGVASPYR